MPWKAFSFYAIFHGIFRYSLQVFMNSADSSQPIKVKRARNKYLKANVKCCTKISLGYIYKTFF